eukprot:g19557.t1
MSWNQQGRWSQKTQNSWKGNWQNAKSKPVEKPTNKSEGFPTYDGAKVDLDAFPTFTPVSLSQPALASSASDGDLKAILKTYMQQNPGKLPKELTELVKPKVVTGSRQAMQKQLNLVKKLDTKLQKKTDHLENKKASWITWKQTLKAFYAAEFERYEKDVKGLQEEIDKLQLERNAEQKKLDEGTFQDVADAGMKDQLSDMEDDLFGPEEPTQVPPKVMDGMAHILNGALMEHLSAEIQNGIAKHFQTMAMSPQMPHRTSGLSERFSEEVKESEPGQPAAGNGETMILELDKVLHFEQDLKQQLQSASQSVLEMFKEAIAALRSSVEQREREISLTDSGPPVDTSLTLSKLSDCTVADLHDLVVESIGQDRHRLALKGGDIEQVTGEPGDVALDERLAYGNAALTFQDVSFRMKDPQNQDARQRSPERVQGRAGVVGLVSPFGRPTTLFQFEDQAMVDAALFHRAFAACIWCKFL